MKEVRMGFVGCGFMGQVAHIANFSALPGCKMVAVADPREDMAAQVAARYGIQRVYKDHTEMAQDSEVDAVAAILPHVANGPVAKDLLGAGKHVLLEKPLAVSVKQGQEMADAAAQAGVHLCVGYMKRFDAGVRWAREAIGSWASEDKTPKFVRAHCYGGDWICGNNEPIMTEESYPPLKVESGGPEDMDDEAKQDVQMFANIYSHNINLVRFLLGGEMTVLSVTPHADRMIVALAVGDTLISLECGGMACQWWDEVTTTYFGDGYVDVKTPSPLLRNVPASVERYRAGDDGMRESPVLPWTWSFRNQAEAFLNTVRGEVEPVNTAADAVKDMELIEDIIRRKRGLR
jgi:predicted dehydrogenase